LSADEITLRLPRERPFFGVAHLVVGGLAVRLDVNYDQLEDIQVALAELLEQQETEQAITLEVRFEDGRIRALLGPFDHSVVDELSRGDGESVGLRRVLDTVVDRVEVTERDGAPWVEVTKAVQS
jgi:anti-sigma regulatory factor (Ser/Thr protein kinase)